MEVHSKGTPNPIEEPKKSTDYIGLGALYRQCIDMTSGREEVNFHTNTGMKWNGVPWCTIVIIVFKTTRLLIGSRKCNRGAISARIFRYLNGTASTGDRAEFSFLYEVAWPCYADSVRRDGRKAK